MASKSSAFECFLRCRLMTFYPFVPATMAQEWQLERKEQTPPSSGHISSFSIQSISLSLHHIINQHIHQLSINNQHISSIASSTRYYQTLFTQSSSQTVVTQSSKMFTKATIVSALAAFAAAMPTVRDGNPNTFDAVSTHSGDQNVHLRTINASGSRFYLNKPTTAFCPQGVANLDCSKCKYFSPVPYSFQY